MFEVIEKGDQLTISGTCIVTGKQYSVTCSKTGYDAWKAGKSVRKALPELSAGDREFLISSISPEGLYLASMMNGLM